ncbi:MAG TPA: serine hydrolase domain-containing protein [Candidatus Acidoferrales bacterium]|nr:serine hydrolase domain-containing protein [Candidatus Acidoferrales bacterium]
MTRATVLLLAALPLAAADLSGPVDALFKDYDQPGVPGASVIVIREGKVLYKRAYGLADLEARTPAAAKTNYRLASCTKQFTAMCIMILAERGRLSLDSPLSRFFPDYPAYGKGITVRQILTHTSGLRAYEELIPPGRTAQLKDRDVLDLLELQTSTYFPPGSDYRYSNTGYAHLALIVEKASGMSFAAFLKKNIFGPLKMRDTVAFEDGVSTVRNRAYGYTKKGDTFERTDQSLTSAVLGDGGIYSSVDDLFLWDQALYTNRLVSPGMMQQAWTASILTSGKQTKYGFGWELGEYKGMKTVRHGGSTIGFRTAILRIPDRKFTVIVLANRGEARPDQLADSVADVYLQ